ncbi:hypothetical protein PC116_g26163 [Phytophthora cactorum]|uniref:Uncharacterized protein n=1 Tax=Phytophthora cactorum TaxID=29920 RepID=A0A8T1JJR4_9STRA|nr:hypothetical protein Pcac1_g15207 [Phytophthora cactorum]KAG2830157.1 hypothetical protein PC113_g21150 [Phytophthora cactorum]KAG2887070.1 hypothetical protein PC114_g18969 [Phytophthora cactorum]KAG2926728.1 hypothetical protein PC117_g14793 [Phytophthora cactorum]KAG2987355.1 hypothetical protein PC119_g19701 [Phytophthora cactorum]
MTPVWSRPSFRRCVQDNSYWKPLSEDNLNDLPPVQTIKVQVTQAAHTAAYAHWWERGGNKSVADRHAGGMLTSTDFVAQYAGASDPVRHLSATFPYPELAAKLLPRSYRAQRDFIRSVESDETRLPSARKYCAQWLAEASAQDTQTRVSYWWIIVAGVKYVNGLPMVHREQVTRCLVSQKVNGFGHGDVDRDAWFRCLQSTSSHRRVEAHFHQETHVDGTETKCFADYHAVGAGDSGRDLVPEAIHTGCGQEGRGGYFSESLWRF